MDRADRAVRLLPVKVLFTIGTLWVMTRVVLSLGWTPLALLLGVMVAAPTLYLLLTQDEQRARTLSTSLALLYVAVMTFGVR